MVVNSTNEEPGWNVNIISWSIDDNHCRDMAEVQSKKRRPNFSDEELHAMIAAV